MEESRIDSPARPAERRNAALDALRGFAVLGIFMMNIQTFAMVQDAYLDPMAHMDLSGMNRTVWVLGHVFFELKFITIFSVLFGAGVAMTAGKDDPDALARHGRRMGWLLLIGMIHAYALWYGDILVAYAVWGLIAAMFLDRRPGVLIAVGAGLGLLTALAFWAQYSSWEQGAGYFPSETWRPSEREIAEAADMARAGWLTRSLATAGDTADVQVSGLIYYGPRVLGCILIGIGLFRTGFLTGGWPARRYWLAAAVGLPVGLGAGALTAWAQLAGEFTPGVLAWTAVVDHVASLPAALGYGALIMLAAKAGWLDWLTRPLAAVGRMALTNYITQSAIAAFLFWGPPGLGWFGTVERTGQAQIVLAVWAAQLVWSPLWLSAFRFGPLEWAWRSLTYRRAQPMLRRAT